MEDNKTNGLYTFKSVGNATAGVAGILGSSGIIKNKGVSSGLSGLASGISAGSALGPWGMAAGAVIGGIAGLVSGNQQQQEEEKALAEQKKLFEDNRNREIKNNIRTQVGAAKQSIYQSSMNNYIQDGVSSSINNIQAMISPSAGGTGLINNRLI